MINMQQEQCNFLDPDCASHETLEVNKTWDDITKCWKISVTSDFPFFGGVHWYSHVHFKLLFTQWEYCGNWWCRQPPGCSRWYLFFSNLKKDAQVSNFTPFYNIIYIYMYIFNRESDKLNLFSMYIYNVYIYIYIILYIYIYIEAKLPLGAPVSPEKFPAVSASCRKAVQVFSSSKRAGPFDHPKDGES